MVYAQHFFHLNHTFTLLQVRPSAEQAEPAAADGALLAARLRRRRRRRRLLRPLRRPRPHRVRQPQGPRARTRILLQVRHVARLAKSTARHLASRSLLGLLGPEIMLWFGWQNFFVHSKTSLGSTSRSLYPRKLEN